MKSIAFIPALLFLLATEALGHGGLKHITASVKYLWGVDTHDHIFMCACPCHGKWKHIPGKLMQIDAGDMEVWGVNSAGDIFKRSADGSGGWKHIGGKLKHVSASRNGYIWGVNSNDDIFKCKKPCNGEWVHVGGKLKQIDAGHDYVYGVNSNNDIFTNRIDGSGGWRQIPGKLTHITASGRDEMFGVADQMFRFQRPCLGYYQRVMDISRGNPLWNAYCHTIGINPRPQRTRPNH